MSAEKVLKSILSDLSVKLNCDGLKITESTFSNKIELSINIPNTNGFICSMSFDKKLDSLPSKKLYGFRQDVYVQLMGMLCESYIVNKVKTNQK